MKKSLIFTLMLVMGLFGCNSAPTAKDISSQFWEAILKNDMETAKQLVTWESVDALKYFSEQQIKLKRYEVFDVDASAGGPPYKVSTIVVIDNVTQADLRIPTNTVVIAKGDALKIDLKGTMTQMLTESANIAADQLNQAVQNGIKELDSVLSNSLSNLGNAVEKITNGLQQNLGQSVDQLSDGLQQNLGQSLEQLNKGLQQGLGQSMGGVTNELQRSLEQGVEQLNKSLQSLEGVVKPLVPEAPVPEKAPMNVNEQLI